jgi:hypothetical protein
MNEGGFWKRSISLCGSSMRGTWKEGSLLGTPKVVLSKALEMRVCFHRGPVLGNMEGCSFPRAFERGVKFHFNQNFYEEF